MSIETVITEIDAEIEKLQKARGLLSSLDRSVKEASAPAKKVTKRRKLSAASRERIAAAQRKRWAATKGAVKAAAAKPEKKATALAKKRKLSTTEARCRCPEEALGGSQG
jgi:hypothetical protein